MEVCSIALALKYSDCLEKIELPHLLFEKVVHFLHAIFLLIWDCNPTLISLYKRRLLLPGKLRQVAAVELRHK